MVTAVIVFLYVGTALFLSQPAYAAAALVVAVVLAILTAYVVERLRTRGARPATAAVATAPAGRQAAAACKVGHLPRQRVSPEHRISTDSDRHAA